jgi:hypothetical protein
LLRFCIGAFEVSILFRCGAVLLDKWCLIFWAKLMAFFSEELRIFQQLGTRQPYCLETSGTNHLVTGSHIPEEKRP